MPGANVRSLQTLGEARAHLALFVEETAAGLGEADGELAKLVLWLSTDRLLHWQREIRIRSERLQQARSNLFRKQLQVSPDHSHAIEEKKAVRLAEERLDEAHTRHKNVKRWLLEWDRELPIYKGAVQPLADLLARELPVAMAALDRMAQALEAYAAIQAPGGEGRDAEAPALTGGDAREEASFARLASGAATSLFAALRRRAFRGPARAAALTRHRREGGPGPLAGGAAVPAGHRGTLARCHPGAAPPPPDALLVVEARALREPLLYIDHGPPLDGGDSGISIGSAAASMGEELPVVTTVGALLALRPDLAEVLSLPRGRLAILAAGAVQAILDENDVDEWVGSPLAPAETQADGAAELGAGAAAPGEPSGLYDGAGPGSAKPQEPSP